MRNALNQQLLIVQLVLCGTLPSLAMTLTTTAQRLRSLIHESQERTILLPGVHDALSAKVFHQAGAECLFLSGFGVSATHLGAPDAGILTLNEMEDTARRVIASTSNNIPVIVDGDTGYGGCSNMRRAVRGLARAGAAAISIEDQVPVIVICIVSAPGAWLISLFYFLT